MKKDKVVICGLIILCIIVSAVSFLTGGYVEMDRCFSVKTGVIEIKWINNCQVFDFSDEVNRNGGITNKTTKNLTLVVYNTLQEFARYRLLLIKPQDWFMGECSNGGVDFWKYYNSPPMTFEAICPCVSEHRTMFTNGKKYVDTYLPLGVMWGDNPQIHFRVNLSMTLHPCVNQSYVSDGLRTCYIWLVWNNEAMIVPFEVRT